MKGLVKLTVSMEIDLDTCNYAKRSSIKDCFEELKKKLTGEAEEARDWALDELRFTDQIEMNLTLEKELVAFDSEKAKVLIETWKKESVDLDLNDMCEIQCALDLIELGEDVVPLLVKDMEEDESCSRIFQLIDEIFLGRDEMIGYPKELQADIRTDEHFIALTKFLIEWYHKNYE